MSKTPFQFTVSQYIVALALALALELALALAQVRIKTKANTFLSQILTQLPRSSLLPIHLSKSTRQHVKWSHRFSFAALKWLSRFSLAAVVQVFIGGGCPGFRWRWLSSPGFPWQLTLSTDAAVYLWRSRVAVWSDRVCTIPNHCSPTIALLCLGWLWTSAWVCTWLHW